MSTLAPRAPGSTRDKFVGNVATERGRQRHLYRLGENLALRDVEIGAHASDVRLETFDDAGHRVERTGRQQHDFRQRVPFRGPVTQSTLVFLNRGREHCRDKAGYAHGSGECDRRTDRIALLRHCRRSAAPCFCGLERFAHFGLREKREVARQFADRCNNEAQKRCDFAQIVALRMPRQGGNREIELRRKRRFDRKTARSERGKSTGGTTKLQHQSTLTQCGQARAMTLERSKGRRELQTQRHRQCLLKPRATGNERCTMHACLLRQNISETCYIFFNERQRVAKLQHKTAIDHVLARRAPMHVTWRTRMRSRNALGQSRNQRDRDIARVARCDGNLGEIEILRAAATTDRIGGIGGNHADRCFGARERCLEIEHSLNARPIGEDLTHRVGREERVKHR